MLEFGVVEILVAELLAPFVRQQQRAARDLDHRLRVIEVNLDQRKDGAQVELARDLALADSPLRPETLVERALDPLEQRPHPVLPEQSMIRLRAGVAEATAILHADERRRDLHEPSRPGRR